MNHISNIIKQKYTFKKFEIEQKLSGGLINKTYLCHTEKNKVILQCLNLKIFKPEVTEDIDQITRYLKVKKFFTFEVISDKTGKTHFETVEGSWRLLTFIEGKIPKQEQDIAVCANFLSKFHSSFYDYPYSFRHHRDIHNPLLYRNILIKTLKEHTKHPFYQQVSKHSEKILQILEKSYNINELPLRLTHGDPKIENFIINNNKQVTMVDFDTVGRREIVSELGDALRSFTNKNGYFYKPYYEEFMEFYLKNNFLIEKEKNLIPIGLKMISYELASRFLADTLNENYFAFDSSKYKTLAEQNYERFEKSMQFADSIDFGVDN